MPLIKTEISTRTRANVAWVAAMLEVSESQVYGVLLDCIIGDGSPEQALETTRKYLRKDEATIDPSSQDTL